MLRSALFLFGSALTLSLFLPSPAAAQKIENVTYKSGDDTVTGYLVFPLGVGKHPAVIVIHEWWGLNDWVKDQAQKFAAQGYMALAVDLYRGQVAKTPDEAHVLMRGLPDDRGLRDLEAAFAYLSSRPDVDAKKIGSIGWCMRGLVHQAGGRSAEACRLCGELWFTPHRQGPHRQNQCAHDGEFRCGG